MGQYAVSAVVVVLPVVWIRSGGMIVFSFSYLIYMSKRRGRRPITDPSETKITRPEGGPK